MSELELLKAIGQGVGLGTIALVAIVIIGRVVKTIGERMIAAIDKLTDRIDAHTKTDVEAHAKVGEEIGGLREDLVGLRERIDAWRDVTPIEGTRRPRSEPGVPRTVGYYGPRKPPREE